jgi:hypothetical protein
MVGKNKNKFHTDLDLIGLTPVSFVFPVSTARENGKVFIDRLRAEPTDRPTALKQTPTNNQKAGH